MSEARETRSTDRIVVTMATLVAWVAITFVGSKILLPGERSLEEVVTQGIAWQIVLAGAMLVAVISWRRWPDLGFRGPDPGTLKLLWLPLLLVVLQFAVAAMLGLPNGGVILLVLLNTLFVGFSEETMFRGILYRTLRGRIPIWPAVLLTSFLFGAVHILNGFITGGFATAFLQAILAGCSGLLLMAIFLRTGSLWVAIIYHALWDAAAFLVGLGASAMAETEGSAAAVETGAPGGFAQFLIPFLTVLPNLLYALWLLRHIHKSTPPGDRQPA